MGSTPTGTLAGFFYKKKQFYTKNFNSEKAARESVALSDAEDFASTVMPLLLYIDLLVDWTPECKVDNATTAPRMRTDAGRDVTGRARCHDNRLTRIPAGLARPS